MTRGIRRHDDLVAHAAGAALLLRTRGLDPMTPAERILVAIFLGALLLWGLVTAVKAGEIGDQVLEGYATVIVDGDTFTLHGGEKIRLWGVDAPELDQDCFVSGYAWPCGGFARLRLVEIIDRRKLRCSPRGKSWERIVAQCQARLGRTDAGKWVDVAAQLVVTGHAVEDPRYSRGAYREIQSYAQQLRKAIWAGGPGGVEMPWIWRARHTTNRKD